MNYRANVWAMAALRARALHPDGAAVTQEEVFAFLAANADHMCSLLQAALPRLELPTRPA